MALWRIEYNGQSRLARGPAEQGPQEVLDATLTLDGILSGEQPTLAEVLHDAVGEEISGSPRPLAPVGHQEVWAAGVTYQRSRDARMDESDTPDPYDKVYEAERPELFFKATGPRVRGPGQSIGVRTDSTWDVPEPELVVVADHRGEIVGYSMGNDVSSRSIEGENPLYLPQAKCFTGSCAIGPCIVLPDELPPIDELSIRLLVERGGVAIYEDRVPVSGLRRRPVDLINWLFHSLDFPLGVMLLTGTATVPPNDFTLSDGDISTVAIDGLGALVTPVEALSSPTAEMRGPRR